MMMWLTWACNHTGERCNPLQICTATELELLLQVCKQRAFSVLKRFQSSHSAKLGSTQIKHTYSSVTTVPYDYFPAA
jgi:hypothetical protein